MKNICWYLNQIKKAEKSKANDGSLLSKKGTSAAELAGVLALGTPVIRRLPITQYPRVLVEKYFAKLPSTSEFEEALKNRYYRQAAESLDESQVEMIVNKLVEKLEREGAI